MTFLEQLKNFFKDSSSGVFTEENYPNLLGAFNKGHIAFLCITAVMIAILCFLLRKTDHKKIKTYLFVSSICWIALEIFKLARIAYQTGALSLARQLPFQICSLYLYALLFSACGKGKLKLIGDNFLAAFGILAGFCGLVFTSIFGVYPVIHFSAMHTLLFHASMIFTGCIMLSTKYVRINYKNIFYSLSIIYAIMLIGIVLNESGLESNYNYMRTNAATPMQFLEFLPHIVYIIISFLIIFFAQVLLYLPSFIIEKYNMRKNINSN